MTTASATTATPTSTPCDEARGRFRAAQDKLRKIEELGNEVRTEVRAARDGIKECMERERRDAEARIAREQADVAAMDRMAEGPLFVWESGPSRAEVNTSALRRLFGGTLVSGLGVGGTLLVLLLLGFFDGVKPQVVTKTERIEVPAPAPVWPRPVIEFKLFDTESRRALAAFLRTNRGQLFPEQYASLRAAVDRENVILRFRVEQDGSLTPVEPRIPKPDDAPASTY